MTRMELPAWRRTLVDRMLAKDQDRRRREGDTIKLGGTVYRISDLGPVNRVTHGMNAEQIAEAGHRHDRG